jgi:hypothetical protein
LANCQIALRRMGLANCEHRGRSVNIDATFLVTCAEVMLDEHHAWNGAYHCCGRG